MRSVPTHRVPFLFAVVGLSAVILALSVLGICESRIHTVGWGVTCAHAAVFVFFVGTLKLYWSAAKEEAGPVKHPLRCFWKVVMKLPAICFLAAFAGLALISDSVQIAMPLAAKSHRLVQFRVRRHIYS